MSHVHIYMSWHDDKDFWQGVVYGDLALVFNCQYAINSKNMLTVKCHSNERRASVAWRGVMQRITKNTRIVALQSTPVREEVPRELKAY